MAMHFSLVLLPFDFLFAVVVAFRGTVFNSWVDWIDDFEAWHIEPSFRGCVNSTSPQSACLVHDGFYSSYMRLQPTIRTLFSALLSKYPNSQFWLTGHSLGAALAVMCGADLSSNLGIKPDQMYTFGLPRTGAF